MKEEKNKGGRPTKYNDKYCKDIVEFMRDGSSKTEFCVEIGIVYDTLLDWKKANPKFSEAIKKADLACQAWWERKGRQATFGQVEGFNATGFIFQMKNRFHDAPESYKDKREVDMNATISSADDWAE